MRISRHWPLSALFCLLLGTTGASATSISGSVLYSSETVGAFGSWSIEFSSSNPGTLLQQVTIDLSPTGLYFDSAIGPPGYLLWQDFQPTNGSEVSTGLGAVNPGTGGVLDGGTWLELNFANFTPANGPFTFLLDVDGVANYSGCAGGLLGIPCRLGRNLDASLVTAEEIAGALVTLNFYVPGSGSAQIITSLGTVGSHTVEGGFATPEPASFVLMGLGLAGFAFVRRASGRAAQTRRAD